MNYNEFVIVMERRLNEDARKSLLEKLVKSTDRFVGLFRATNPKAKLNQFVSQSREIRFGDAMEEIIGYLLEDAGYKNLNKVIKDYQGEELNLDQYYKDDNMKHFFVEQKVRDDHDSTKKRGQFQNFMKKHDALKEKHGDIVGAMYFIDPSLKKNRKYYSDEMVKERKENNSEIHMFYGEEFFEFIGRNDMWNTLLEWLEKWRNEAPEVLDMNFDVNPQEAFDEIKSLDTKVWKKILSIDELWESGIMKVLFETGETLDMMCNYFDKIGERTLSNNMKKRITNYIR